MEEQFYLIFPTIWILTSRRWKGRVFLGILSVLIIWNLVANQGRFGGINIPVVRQGFVCICCGVLIAIYEFRARLLAKAVPAFVIPAVALILFLYPANADDLKATAYKCLFLPPAIGLLLMFSLERGPWLRAFLRWAPIQAIGITSYGIYLWQELFTAPKMFYTGRGMVISLLLPLLCVVVPLSYFLVEKPAMRYGRTLAARIRERSIPTATVA
jgi:peptidoglycan/LPS O-acetylase OafA/YrhL